MPQDLGAQDLGASRLGKTLPIGGIDARGRKAYEGHARAVGVFSAGGAVGLSLGASDDGCRQRLDQTSRQAAGAGLGGDSGAVRRVEAGGAA